MADERYPEWWTNERTGFIDSTAPADDYSMATTGQAKWITIQAVSAVRQVSSELADELSEALRAQPYVVLDIERELNTPLSPERRVDSLSPLRLGQAKALSKPFYDLFNREAPEWLAKQFLLNGLEVEGEDHWTVTANDDYWEGGLYPWNPESGSKVNLVPTTQGQLKLLFSFRFNTLSEHLKKDIDGDGVLDEDEELLGLDKYRPDAPTVGLVLWSPES